MNADKPTAQVNLDSPRQQPDDDEKRTAIAGKEANQTSPTVAASGSPFQPTSPSRHPTPPSPKPAPPRFPPRPPSPVPAAPGDQTVIMEAEREPIPLAWLAVVEGVGSSETTVYTLNRETVVGRTTGDLLLHSDPAASGQHLKIRLETNAQNEQTFVLYDLASSNGVYVGDRETYREEESRVYRHVLKDGDFILVGQTTLVFKQV